MNLKGFCFNTAFRETCLSHTHLLHPQVTGYLLFLSCVNSPDYLMKSHRYHPLCCLNPGTGRYWTAEPSSAPAESNLHHQAQNHPHIVWNTEIKTVTHHWKCKLFLKCFKSWKWKTMNKYYHKFHFCKLLCFLQKCYAE